MIRALARFCGGRWVADTLGTVAAGSGSGERPAAVQSGTARRAGRKESTFPTALRGYGPRANAGWERPSSLRGGVARGDRRLPQSLTAAKHSLTGAAHRLVGAYVNRRTTLGRVEQMRAAT